MIYYATIDTNVLISALLTKKPDAATVKVFHAVLEGKIIPLYNDEILKEYSEVLRREKFGFEKNLVEITLRAICQFGMRVARKDTKIHLPDMDDLVFYEITMTKAEEGAKLITGNQKHYPVHDFIVTPAEMIAILSGKE